MHSCSEPPKLILGNNTLAFKNKLKRETSVLR